MTPTTIGLASQLCGRTSSALQEHGIQANWSTVRQWLSSQVRVTAVFQRPDGRALHVRKATRPEGQCRQLWTPANGNGLMCLVFRGYERSGRIGSASRAIQTSRSRQACVSAGSQSWKKRVRTLANAARKLT